MNREGIKERFVLHKNIKTGSVFWTTDDGSDHEVGGLRVLFRSNAITIFMCVELMLNSVNLLLVAFSSFHQDSSGQVFVFFIMAVAAAEVAVGLAILVTIFRNVHSVDIDDLKALKN
jgi:NADH-quinone oxidoreductase subunit K